MTTKATPASVTSTDGHNGNGFAAAYVSKGKYSTKSRKAQPPHNTMIAWALRYALAGYRVLPLVPGGKNPLTANGVYDATDDPETIAAWWNQWPTANIGLALGADLVAVDIDPRNGGELTYLDRLGLDASSTAMQRTGSGGWHVIYVKPASMRFVSHVHGFDGLDVLTGEKYIVVAPSIVNGNRYRWERDPIECPPARMPLSVAERLQERRQTAQAGPGTAQAAGGEQWTLKDAEDMLKVVKPWQNGYHWWVSILAALHSEFGDEALALAEEWADGKPGEVARKFKSFRKEGITFRTLVYYAKRNGWKPAGADDEDDAGIPEHWRITSEDWDSCPLCAALYTEEFSDGTVRTFHRWCRQPSCQVYRKVKTRKALAPVFQWAGIRSEVVSSDDWRQWRENASETVGKNWRGLPVGEDQYLALYESSDGEDRDALLNMAAAAILEKPKGRNVSTPRRRRNLADGPVPGPSPKERPQPVRQIMVSRFAHRRRVLTILDRLGIEWERQRLGGWKTAPLSDGQRIALRTAFEFGVPGARSLNSALGTTVELTVGGWEDPYPRTVQEYRLDAVRQRYKARIEVPKSP